MALTEEEESADGACHGDGNHAFDGGAWKAEARFTPTRKAHPPKEPPSKANLLHALNTRPINKPYGQCTYCHRNPATVLHVGTSKEVCEGCSEDSTRIWCPRHYPAGQLVGPHQPGTSLSCGCCAGTCEQTPPGVICYGTKKSKAQSAPDSPRAAKAPCGLTYDPHRAGKNGYPTAPPPGGPPHSKMTDYKI